MKRLILSAALALIAGLACAQDLNDIHIALNTAPDSANFYYYVNIYPKLGQWDIKKARAKEYGAYNEYALEGKFERIWLLSPHDAIIKDNGKYALFNLDTRKYTTRFEYLDVRFGWGGKETGPIGLYSKTKNHEGWELYHLVDTAGKRQLRVMETAPADSFSFIARNRIKLYKDGKESMIDDKGATIIPFQYSHFGEYRIYDGGKTTIVDVRDEDGRFGLIRIRWDGTVDELAPCAYDAVDISKWPCIIEKDGKKAIVYDRKGGQTELIFDQVDWYPQGMIVRIGEKFGFQKWGNLKLPVEYDSMEIVESAETSNKKAISASKEDGVYLYDTNAKLLDYIPAEVPEPVDSLQQAPLDSLIND